LFHVAYFLKCVVTEVVLFSIVAFKTLTSDFNSEISLKIKINIWWS